MADEIKSSCLPGKLSEHDYVTALWSYRSKDIHVRIEGGNTFHTSFPFQAGYMANFEKASVVYTSLKCDIIGISDNTALKEVPAGDIGTGYYNETAYFAECVNNNAQPLECMPDSSLQSIKLCYEHIKK